MQLLKPEPRWVELSIDFTVTDATSAAAAKGRGYSPGDRTVPVVDWSIIVSKNKQNTKNKINKQTKQSQLIVWNYEFGIYDRNFQTNQYENRVLAFQYDITAF